MEKYTYWEAGKSLSVLPIISFQQKRNWYAELRYNYEEDNAASLHLGRTFSTEGPVSCNFTPLVGLVAGKLQGISAGFNMDAEYGDLFAGASSQYVASFQSRSGSFFYNWSEAGYNISDHVFAGLSLQYTAQREHSFTEPGILAGLSFRNISFPCYLFNPFRTGSYVIVGMNYQYDTPKAKRPFNNQF